MSTTSAALAMPDWYISFKSKACPTQCLRWRMHSASLTPCRLAAAKADSPPSAKVATLTARHHRRLVAVDSCAFSNSVESVRYLRIWFFTGPNLPVMTTEGASLSW